MTWWKKIILSCQAKTTRKSNAIKTSGSLPKAKRGVYPELLIPAEKRVINNITLRIENEKFEVPDFNDEEIIYV